jgi:signal transduction histidine kinase
MRHGTSHTPTHTYADERRAATAHGARVAAASAVSLLPFFAYFDTVLFPPPFPRYVVFRAIAIGIALAVIGLTRTAFGKRHPLALGVLVPISIGLNIDFIAVVAGRETNPYFAGHIVLLLGVSLLFPWTALPALALSVLLIGSYAGALLATGPIANPLLFTSNLLVLGSAAVLVVVAATISDRLRRREFESRAALDAHARRQEAVARLGQLALAGTDPRELMERATALVPETLDFTLSGVLELSADGTSLLLRSGAGWNRGVVGRATIAASPGTHARFTLDAGAAVLSERLDQETRFVPMPLLKDHGATTGLCVPIIGRERPFGLLIAYANGTGSPRCDTLAAECLESLAGVLTTALLRQEADAALAAEAQNSAALAALGRDLISSLETPVLLQRLCQRTAEVLGTDHSVTWLLDEEESIYRPISSHGLPTEKWESLRTVRVPSHAIPLLLERLGRDELVELSPDLSDQAVATGIINHFGITRSLLLPLRRGGELVGIQANGYRGRTTPFTRQQEKVGHAIAQLASMALSNARLVEELERASRLKSEFVSTMSHELRTPLNVIVGYLDILGDELGDTPHTQLLSRARSASIELLEMIEATLNLNRLSAGQDPPVFADLEIGDLWEELQADFGAIPRKTNAALRWEPVGRVALRTDRRKLKIVVKNLVGNALKFTPQGMVCAQARREGPSCVITVTDTGIGIPGAHLPHIFDMFRQVDSSDARSYAGAGLGLYIVKSLLTQLEGEVSVESTPGRGSTFRITLPLVPAASPAVLMPTAEAPSASAAAGADHEPPVDLAQTDRQLATAGRHAAQAQQVAAGARVDGRRRIVFADDVEVNRCLMERFFEREMPDVECFVAADGTEALRLVAAHHPDLVILDLRMPEMDGWQAARRIRELPAGRDVPILALSVTASPGVVAHALHAGCNEFIPKPVSDYRGLMDRITYWLRPADPSGRPLEPSAVSTCLLCRQPLPKAPRPQAAAQR